MSVGRAIGVLLGVVLSLSAGSVGAQNVKRVAVLPLTNAADLQSTHLVLLTDTVRQQGIRTLPRQFQMMTQANMMAFIPQGKTLADCIGQCAVETGKRLKAHYVVTGQIERIGGGLRAVLSVHATKSGRFLETVELRGNSVLGLEQAIQKGGGAVFAAIRSDTEGSRFALGGLGGVVGGASAPTPQTIDLPDRAAEFVRFESIPPGIQVRVDDERLCKTPCQRVLPYGPHVVEFRSRCHETEVQRLRLSASKETVRIAVQPKPNSATTPLTIETDAGEKVMASVLVNGRLNAKTETPGEVQLDLSACVVDGAQAETDIAAYEVKVVAKGYVPEIIRTKAATKSRTVSLKKMPVLDVECSDAGSPIFVDGAVKARSPHRFSDLPPGRYMVACGRPDWATARKAVQLEPGDKKSLRLEVPRVARIELSCENGKVEHILVNGGPLEQTKAARKKASRGIKVECIRALGKKKRPRKVYRAKLAECLRSKQDQLKERAKGIVRLKTNKRSPLSAQLDLLPGEYSFECKGAASSDQTSLKVEPGSRHTIALSRPESPRRFGMNLGFEFGGGLMPAKPMMGTFTHDGGTHTASMSADVVGAFTLEAIMGYHLTQFFSLNLSFFAGISDSDEIRLTPDETGYDVDYYLVSGGLVGELYLPPRGSPALFLSAGIFGGQYKLELDQVTHKASEETEHTVIDTVEEPAKFYRFKVGFHWKQQNYPHVGLGGRLGVSMLCLRDFSNKQWGGFVGFDF